MRLCIPAVVLALLASTASAGVAERITARLASRPGALSVGAVWTARVRLAVNGRPLAGAKARLTARSGSRSQTFILRPSPTRGLYSAKVALATAGRWALSVRVRARRIGLGSVRVRPRQADVRGPFDLAVAPDGRLAVADRDADRVVVVDPQSGSSRIAATGLDDPIAVGYDASGNLYANSGERIVRLEANQRAVIVGTGVRGHSGDGGPATAAQLGGVGAFAFASTGDLYLPEYDNWIRRVGPNGIIETIAGTGSEGFGGDGGPAAVAAIAAPHALTVAADGSIVIADSHNGRIRRIDSSGTITTLASGFAAPVSIASAADGSVVVGDVGTGRLERIGTGGSRSIVASGLQVPSGVAVDARGNVYFSEYDASRVRRIDAGTGRISTVLR